jgi:hypothetical protein
MGYQVTRLASHSLGLALAVCAAPALANAEQAPGSEAVQPSSPAGGIELMMSTDSDKTDVVKLLGRGLWSFNGPDEFKGIDLEAARYSPQGQHSRKQERIYLDLADSLGSKWRWRARVGTNGHTVLGSATLRASDWSKEFFVERDIVETARGVDEGLYYTFVGGSFDFPAGKRDVFNAMAGVQKFTGRNERLHLRGSYVHVIKSSLGLSAQLRGRYYHSTRTGEFDYYSPRDFLQLLPVLQMRRFDSRGWMYLAALGYGAQKATGSQWHAARLADLRVESPASSHGLQAFAQVQYSNTSLSGGGGDYHYVMGRLGLTLRLKMGR